ncbi:acyl-CoA dehydrogenase [Rhodococcus wratislaviensis]|uniref:Acyl-CoA dehydrogenase n=1 Tax=Rhodococcus wratislaviensis TaxID=44752 RepID=A0AB38FMT2_RHOWR|nr:acyl-CoA dehydrogenase family protein [Rhodococcus wratislaviensis]REE74176.1 acyl-CoA dehydrogenase [Rhodococcus wratislaviensis]SPZ42856.1 acyl-CoA dehydrogenase [Rhodococcus wratislaviensis]
MTGPATDTEMREFARMLDQVFATDRRAPGEAREFDRELWSTLADLGLTRLTGPESEGGSDAGWTESAYLLAAAGTADLPIAENDLLAGWLLGRSGCPTAHSGPAVVRTAAVLDSDGTARHVPWARSVDALVALWEADGTWRVAEFARSDVEVTEAANLASMPRDHVRVDVSAQQGTPVPADVVTEFLRRGALARALAMAGTMERVLALVVEHTSARTQFGRAVGKFQAVQAMVADIAAEGALARAAANAAVSIAEEHGFGSPEAGFAVAAAKSCAGHAASVVVRNAHQCLGAIGFTMEHELHRHTNALLAWRSEYGSVRYWDEALVAAAAAAGERGLWPLITDG